MNWLLPVGCFCVALLVLYLAVRLIGRCRWFWAWVRGTAALALLSFAALLILFGVDLLSYQRTVQDQWIGKLSFEQTGRQHFEVTLVNAAGAQQRFQLGGDQWQLDAQQLRLPVGSLFRLEQLSGRYLTIEQERNEIKTSYAMEHLSGPIDTWRMALRFPAVFPFLVAESSRASFLPMADGAIYSLSFGPSGLVGKPMNRAARAALANWYSAT